MEVIQIKDGPGFIKQVGDYVIEQLNTQKLKGAQIEESEKSKWYTREEVIKIFNISLTTLHSWNNKGILNPYKIGNRVLYDKTEIDNAPQLVKPE